MWVKHGKIKQCHFYHPWLGMVVTYHLYIFGDFPGVVTAGHCFTHIKVLKLYKTYKNGDDWGTGGW
jgi:hypothetical protein